MRIRPVFFWLHLVSGVIAGAVILLMCVTGVLLTYERQIYAWYDSDYRSQPVAGAARMPIDLLLARVQAQVPDAAPASVTVNAGAEAPVTVAAGPRTFYIDAYSGTVLGETRAQGVRQFMSEVKAWHRWLAVEGDGRQAARAITGWSNLLFLFIVASGLYLWIPRRWAWQTVRAVLFFRRTGTGKARDFNWHNVIGFWSAVPLFIVVFAAVPISFPWANAMVYQAMGEPVPAGGREGGPRGGGGGREGGPREGGPREGGFREGGPRAAGAGREAGGAGGGERAERGEGGERGGARPAPASFDGLDALFARAKQQEPDWRTITLRLPNNARAPLAFAIDRGDGGQPQLRSTLTLARADASVVSYEKFEAQSPARRLRSIMRFAHTGEVLGIPGQTIAGLVTAGGAVLVYTGIALAIRRLFAWRTRRRTASVQARSAA